MKRPNITSGPWRTNHDPEAIADVWQDSTNPRRFVSCSPFTGNRSRMREQEERDEWAANARAIAAVPDCLDTLEALYWYHCAKHPHTESDMDWLAEKVKTALEKAGFTIP